MTDVDRLVATLALEEIADLAAELAPRGNPVRARQALTLTAALVALLDKADEPTLATSESTPIAV